MLLYKCTKILGYCMYHFLPIKGCEGIKKGELNSPFYKLSWAFLKWPDPDVSELSFVVVILQ